MNNLFYSTDIRDGFVRFDEEESRHLATVLRHKVGDQLLVTDGKGMRYETELVETGKKGVIARILQSELRAPEQRARLHVAMAPTKNTDRLEWFLEKAGEMGIDEFTPLLCKRGIRDRLRYDRLERIMVSAMKQSLRYYLPKLNPLTPFETLVQTTTAAQRFIPWCDDAPQPQLSSLLRSDQDTLILIGPEGDFSPEEVALARAQQFREVSLGDVRLRAETAALYVVMGFHWNA